ncbi:MAG: hypothetical protein EP330_11195 [Deltaproteobacteria bacterium]|nr:MAG: hypothetical protein EP330_11195 [Deltaproteobacteria bacterium]
MSGDAQQVWLVSGGASTPIPGVVPAGSYQIKVQFPGQAASVVGQISITGGSVNLECTAKTGKCARK